MKSKPKIIATLGPSSFTQKTVEKMDFLGVEYFRINLSHTDISDVSQLVNKFRRWSDKKICFDTEGAQLRTEIIKNEKLYINFNDELKLISCNSTDKENSLKLNIENPQKILNIGDILNIDFNGAVVQIIDKDGSRSLKARVLKKGLVLSNKGIGVDRSLDLPCFSDKDNEILSLASKLNIKTFFLSFCSSKNDVENLRKKFDYNIEIISKIESTSGIKNLHEICSASESILIDRGDLSRDVPIEKIPHAQKYIINVAKSLGVKVHIATNLMESMLTNSQPTRAELNDIVGSINDGASGLVLAAETAIGKHPVDSVRILSNIIKGNNESYNNVDSLFSFNSPLLNKPMGGYLVNNYSSYSENEIYNLKSMKINKRCLTDIIQICIGTYSPLDRFMALDEVESVLDNFKLRDGSVWTLPIIMQISEHEVSKISLNEPLALKYGENDIVAVFRPDKIEKVDSLREKISLWFGTDDQNHPGVKYFKSEGDYMLSGKPYLIKKNISKYFSKYELTPDKSRSLFHSYGWHKIVGFHTRNVPHKGHEFIQQKALKIADADAIFISPVSGIKKIGDFKTKIIIKCYNELVNKMFYDPFPALISPFNTYSRYAGPREAAFTAICRKNYGCSHFIIGRDHTGLKNYYDKNAYNILDELDLGISLIRFSEVVYDQEKNKYLENIDLKKSEYIKKISATKLRGKINDKSFKKDYILSDIVFNTLMDFVNDKKELFIV